ncbi:N-formylglutamate amidohydrolase [Thalassococcus sp. BH17M4-6]|uniref:N-formylglutamate amidohydrolase n=1 Tax=Thalassococcus sp. BH17M4-6 TaxID=3413148 RepID=UPI003BC72CAF
MSEPVQIVNPDGSSAVVLVCEHAANTVPAGFAGLGLDDAALQSHVAWDPGAMGVARGLSARLDAVLVAATVSRLVYDCNRPPEAPDAMPARSELTEVPGNAALTQADRALRVQRYYAPFRAALADRISRTREPILVTVHSFTPVYFGKPRETEIGVLFDTDDRLARAMLSTADRHMPRRVAANDPYGPEDGVTHTLREHALPQGHPNVMLEIRNDLIATPSAQDAMARDIADWLVAACASLGIGEAVQCHA